jgi:hypothetical protein
MKEIEGMIETGAENRRGTTGIFGGAEDYDRIRWVKFLQGCGVYDLNRSNGQKRCDQEEKQKQQTKPPARTARLVGGCAAHSSSVILA